MVEDQRERHITRASRTQAGGGYERGQRRTTHKYDPSCPVIPTRNERE